MKGVFKHALSVFLQNINSFGTHQNAPSVYCANYMFMFVLEYGVSILATSSTIFYLYVA